MQIQLLREILTIAFVALLFTSLFCLILALCLRYLRKTGKLQLQIQRKRWGLIALFMIYVLTVLGITVLSRTETIGGVDLNLFSSYRNAYNRFDWASWSMPIYNILMFIPLGVLLPLFYPFFEKKRIAFPTFALFTLFIEGTQYFFHIGVFEVDDLFNNFIGAFIGWGLMMAIIRFRQRKEQTQLKTFISCFVYCLPLLVTLSILFGIVLCYYIQPYGNFENGPIVQKNMSQIEMIDGGLVSNQRDTAWVYRRETLSQDELQNRSNQIAECLDIENLTISSMNKNQIVKTNESYSLTLKKEGTFLVFQKGTDFIESSFEEKKEELKKLQSIYPISLLSFYEIQGELVLPFTPFFDEAYSGSIVMEMNDNQELVYLDFNLRRSFAIKEEEIISTKEAWQKLASGWFRLYGYNDMKKMECLSVALVYQKDTKNYYQPVYEFIVRIDDMAVVELLIPALV